MGRVEFEGSIKRIRYEEYDGGYAEIELTVVLVKPMRPLSPGYGASEDEVREYKEKLKEWEVLRNMFYKFRIGPVKIIQEQDEDQEVEK